MRHIILFIVALLHLPIATDGQTLDFPNRKSEIEKFTEKIYSVTDFKRIVDSLQVPIIELYHYPVIFPVKYPYISSNFGKRKHPIFKTQKNHTGIDFSKVKGTPVYATGNGVVIRTGYGSGYGYFVEIKHAGGFRSFYAHLSKTLVSIGDSVSIGKHIASVGNSGLTTGSHLHYEVRKEKRFINPTNWCYCLLDVLKSK